MSLPDKIVKEIEARSGMRKDGIFGPFAFLDGSIYEVVVKKGSDTNDAYVFTNGADPQIFDNVESLSLFTQSKFVKLRDKLEAKIEDMEMNAAESADQIQSRMQKKIESITAERDIAISEKNSFNERRFLIYAGTTFGAFALISITWAIFKNPANMQPVFTYVFVGVVCTVFSYIFGKWIAPRIPGLNQ